MKDLLRAYAELVVRVGVNLQKDQILVINAPNARRSRAQSRSRPLRRARTMSS